MMFGYGSDWAFWQVAMMWLGMIAFWGLLIWAVFGLTNRTTPGPNHAHGNSEARHILDQHLAKGEIDTEEYCRLRDLMANDERSPVGARDRR